MVSSESIRAAYHEFAVVIALPIILGLTWFLFAFFSIDPPFLYFGFAIAGIALAGMYDSRAFPDHQGLNVLLVRLMMVFVCALISLFITGFIGVVAGPATPKGPFSLLTAVLAFTSVFSIVRCVTILISLATQFDMEAVTNYFSGNARGDGGGDPPPGSE